MPAFGPMRRWCWIIGGVLGFWTALVALGELGWVPAEALFEIFLVSTIALALAVGAAGMLAFMEDKPRAGPMGEGEEDPQKDGQKRD